jgi:hypothetical protein
MGLKFGIIAAFAAMVCATAAAASPWAEVGDAQLRSDIEILAAAGLIDDVTTHWPLPWASIVARLRRGNLDKQPEYLRDAAGRVLRVAQGQAKIDQLRISVWADVASDRSVIRGFDGMGRETAQGQLAFEYMTDSTALRVALGAQTLGHGDTASFMPDNSYFAQKIGGAVLYAGYLPHWWGPGWISSLTLSNNARPFPQIGIERGETDAFQSPWLSWLGPWQAELFIGILDGPRIAKNTGFVGTRVTINPLPSLELAISRTTQICGTGQRCVPLADYFSTPLQSPSSPDHTNDESGFDAKYSGVIRGWPFEVYLQLMNEDNGPFVQSATSHLFGATVWMPIAKTPLRLTFEYADSVATRNIFSFGNPFFGTAYNNFQYIDGMRYRARTLGFSLDSDSRLYTLQASWRDEDERSYELSLHHAQIMDPASPKTINFVTTAPVEINMAEARVTLPFHHWKLDLAGRLQDDQPRPDHGFKAAIEAAIVYNFF